jgi:hypothetical protein
MAFYEQHIQLPTLVLENQRWTKNFNDEFFYYCNKKNIAQRAQELYDSFEKAETWYNLGSLQQAQSMEKNVFHKWNECFQDFLPRNSNSNTAKICSETTIKLQDYIKDLEKTQEERKEKGKFPLRVCLLLDDIVFEGFNRNRVGTLEKLLMTCRHYNISVILLLQHTKMISSAMRNQIFFWIVFRLTAVDLVKFSIEHSNLLTKDEFIEMYNDIQKKGKHEFLIVDYKKDVFDRFSHRFTTPIDISQYKV